jgi:hypothetical protein
MRILTSIRALLVWLLSVAASKAQLDSSYYGANIAPLLPTITPAERAFINPSAPAYQQFSEGSQSLPTPFQARVYIGGEGGNYCSLLAFTDDGSGSPSGTSQTIFGNASIPPLAFGDFADLGTFSAQTPLDFYMIIDFNSCLGLGPRGIASTQSRANTDAVQDHTIQLLNHLGANGNRYLVYGFEDEPGLGDSDFNDLVFTLELSAVPEPNTLIVFVTGISIFALVLRRRLITPRIARPPLPAFTSPV